MAYLYESGYWQPHQPIKLKYVLYCCFLLLVVMGKCRKKACIVLSKVLLLSFELNMIITLMFILILREHGIGLLQARKHIT